MSGPRRPGAEAGGGPRVTEQSIKDKILTDQYEFLTGTTVTVCAITMKNGFVVVGESACADPENFNEKLGRENAYARAFEKLWALEGYLLREQMSQGKVTKAAN